MKKENILLIILFLGFLPGCGSERNIISSWAGGSIIIDGDITDWHGSLDTLSDYKALLGIKNNQSNLYICIATADFRQALRIIKSNFIAWFEPEEHPDKTLGIKFPLRDILDEEQDEYKYVSFMPGREKPWSVIDKLIKGQDELQVLNSKKYPLSLLPLKNNEGIEAALNVKDTLFVYELCIPLQENNNNKFPINAKPGEIINITFETEDEDFGRMRGGPPTGGGFPGQDNPSGNIPPGKRPAGPKEGITFEEPAKPLNLSLKVTVGEEKK